MQRRRFIKSVGGIALVGALAGCTTDDEEEANEQTGDAENTDDNLGNNESTGTKQQQTKEKKQEQKEKKGLRILDHEFYEDDFTAGVKGTAINETGDTLGYVGVEAVFLDKEKTQIGEGLDNVTDLKNGRKWKFDAMLMGENKGNVDSYEISIADSPF